MASLTISCSAPALNQITRQHPARPSCSLRFAPSTASRSASLRPHHAAFRSAARLPNLQSASRSRAAGLVVRAEQSYVMIKPDGVQRGLVSEVIGRIERKGFKLIGLKMQTASRELAEEHYKDLSSKPFFPALVDYIISGPVVCMVWEGDNVVPSIRKIVGATNPVAAEPGTIRGDYARVSGRNIVHASDSPDNGVREAELWFGKDSKLEEWTVTNSPWLVE